MDALAHVLDGPRAHDAFLLRMLLDPPWSIFVEDEAPLQVLAVVQGGASLAYADEPAQPLVPGDVAVLRGPGPYVVSDVPGRQSDVVIGADGMCRSLDGRVLVDERALGVRTWGNARAGATVMLVGTYGSNGEVSRRLLGMLPGAVVVHPNELDSPLVGLLADEITKDAPGQRAVLDRLLDLLVIAVLRAWFDRPAEHAGGSWWRARTDPVVWRAVQLLHRSPDEPWTIATLARECGISRAGLARRFTALVGEPPMTYLTGWRIALAADLLQDPDATLASVARQVGYASPFALSAAFKRVRGVSPRQHRVAG